MRGGSEGKGGASGRWVPGKLARSRRGKLKRKATGEGKLGGSWAVRGRRGTRGKRTSRRILKGRERGTGENFLTDSIVFIQSKLCFPLRWVARGGEPA